MMLIVVIAYEILPGISIFLKDLNLNQKGEPKQHSIGLLVIIGNLLYTSINVILALCYTLLDNIDQMLQDQTKSVVQISMPFVKRYEASIINTTYHAVFLKG